MDIPLIIVSEAIGGETAVQAMKAGAYDYIMKGNVSRIVAHKVLPADHRPRVG